MKTLFENEEFTAERGGDAVNTSSRGAAPLTKDGEPESAKSCGAKGVDGFAPITRADEKMNSERCIDRGAECAGADGDSSDISDNGRSGEAERPRRKARSVTAADISDGAGDLLCPEDDEAMRKIERTDTDSSPFTVSGICFTVAAVLSLCLAIFLSSMCVASAVSASEALDALLAVVSGESEELADAMVGLISGAVSLIAFGLAAIIAGCISSHLVKRAAESETGVVRLIGKIAGIVSLVNSIAVYPIAAVAFIL